MNPDLTDEETAALLRELDGLIDGDRYFMSQGIKTLKAIRAKIRPEPAREPLPPPPKQYAPPRATARQRRRAGRPVGVTIELACHQEYWLTDAADSRSRRIT
jgi:hypothetical protein